MNCECFTFYAVSSSPILDSARQTSSTSVRVEWSQPSGGATVTGYVVHYSDGDTDRIESVPASPLVLSSLVSPTASHTPSQWRLPQNICLESLKM